MLNDTPLREIIATICSAILFGQALFNGVNTEDEDNRVTAVLSSIILFTVLMAIIWTF